jgi:hypothetical protein
MDPDAALEELLGLTGPLLNLGDTEPGLMPATAGRIAELVDALDGWLLAGGYLPRRWAGRLQSACDRSGAYPREDGRC